MRRTANEDAPIITAVIGTGTVVDAVLPTSASGTINFADLDLTDSHTVTATPAAGGYLGTFTPIITNTGEVLWIFKVDDAALHLLVEGQTQIQTYTVTVADNQGGEVNQIVTITITGQPGTAAAEGPLRRDHRQRLEFITRALAAHESKWKGYSADFVGPIPQYAGSFPDLIKAFRLCTENDHPLDKWIADAVLIELTEAFHSGRTASGKRGKASPKAKYKNNIIAHMRWSWARHWLANCEELPHHGHPATQDGAFAYAHQCLKKTIARGGSPDTIKQNYKKVEREIKLGTFVSFDLG